jgi:hypothetical protein
MKRQPTPMCLKVEIRQLNQNLGTGTATARVTSMAEDEDKRFEPYIHVVVEFSMERRYGSNRTDRLVTTPSADNPDELLCVWFLMEHPVRWPAERPRPDVESYSKAISILLSRLLANASWQYAESEDKTAHTER